MCKMKELVALLLVAVQIQNVKPVIHILKYIHTTSSSQIPNFPDYLAVGYVDGVQISHYDSKSRNYTPKQEWMNKITPEDPSYWERNTQRNIVLEDTDKVNIKLVQTRFNQTGGVHMIQWLSGCEWDDETGKVDGWQHFAYDGEDFLSFDWKGLRWIAVKPQAVITKHKWDQLESYNQYKKYYYTEECLAYLKKFVSYGRDFLMRTELPRISLLQKTPLSPVTCHASGFYPRNASLFWRKDRKRISEGGEIGETLPNHDGTFQVTAHLKAVDANANYECAFQLFSGRDNIIVPLDAANVLSNKRIEAEERRKTALAVGVPVGVTRPDAHDRCCDHRQIQKSQIHPSCRPRRF
ncbi:class I histocompatibility antigen, F10 alpha chain-like [Corythoichthys intestinalis]|uniref:class I histocompatibility antigen, F10 alpha chain-like n=1 Tax=Corythoichthys intestinalis TaxID=161448 RepID=UPI0025A4FC75|nr:class I histocompatibility antigen, F10 alpha chain-like [Corythoichthys intestinalis]